MLPMLPLVLSLASPRIVRDAAGAGRVPLLGVKQTAVPDWGVGDGGAATMHAAVEEFVSAFRPPAAPAARSTPDYGVISAAVAAAGIAYTLVQADESALAGLGGLAPIVDQTLDDISSNTLASSAPARPAVPDYGMIAIGMAAAAFARPDDAETQ